MPLNVEISSILGIVQDVLVFHSSFFAFFYHAAVAPLTSCDVVFALLTMQISNEKYFLVLHNLVCSIFKTLSRITKERRRLVTMMIPSDGRTQTRSGKAEHSYQLSTRGRASLSDSSSQHPPDSKYDDCHHHHCHFTSSLINIPFYSLIPLERFAFSTEHSLCCI